MNLKEAQSRIDTIWVDYYWKQSIIICKTKDMDLRTGSNYQAVFVQLETGLNLQKRSQAENQRVRKKRLEINMENLLKNKTLNELWNIIANSIKKLATNTATKEKDLCNRGYSTLRYSDQKAQEGYTNARKMKIQLDRIIKSTEKGEEELVNKFKEKSRFQPIEELKSSWHETLLEEVIKEE
ncbi:11152_t:CDS:2 [Gigaspora margarita]|uniref:11152_t:CDS:1 n=1 Tax=Gigaspora margarita TaxID=4874 RepID=A0ABN7VPW5_GIGMA|nr:11152_t:CDS:2 [Gigaspora margarita]